MTDPTTKPQPDETPDQSAVPAPDQAVDHTPEAVVPTPDQAAGPVPDEAAVPTADQSTGPVADEAAVPMPEQAAGLVPDEAAVLAPDQAAGPVWDEAVVPTADQAFAPSPYAAVIPTPPARKRRTVPVVLSLLALLLVGASVAVGVLYSNQTSRNTTLTGEVAGKEKGVADSGAKVRENAESLVKSQEALKAAGEAQQKAETEGAPLVACHDAANRTIKFHFARDEDSYQKALTEMYAAC